MLDGWSDVCFATTLIAIGAETVAVFLYHPLPWQSERVSSGAFVRQSCKEPEVSVPKSVFPIKNPLLVFVSDRYRLRFAVMLMLSP